MLWHLLAQGVLGAVCLAVVVSALPVSPPDYAAHERDLEARVHALQLRVSAAETSNMHGAVEWDRLQARVLELEALLEGSQSAD
jgi:hypothetical protein